MIGNAVVGIVEEAAREQLVQRGSTYDASTGANRDISGVSDAAGGE
jgi:hypothetical protein